MEISPAISTGDPCHRIWCKTSTK